MPCLVVASPSHVGGKLRSACDPCPLMARTEPPGRLRSSTGSPYEPHWRRISPASPLSVSLIRIAPGLFQSLVRPPLGRSASARLTRVVLFQPHGLQNVHMSLSTLLIYGRRSTAASLWSVRNPCVIQADSEPPGRHPPAPGSQSPSHQPVTGRSFASSGEVRLSTALADFRHISFVLAESQALTWALMHCPYWLTPLHLCGKLRYACNPCPIMAGSVPPGRLPLLHRVPISDRGSLRGHSSWWASFRLSANALLSKPVSFRLTAPGLDMSLSTFLSIATVAQRRTRSVRNPCVIQADAEPPGRRPPAPGSHPRRTRSVTGGPFEYLGRLTVTRLTPVPESRFHPYGTQGYWDEPL